MMTKAITNENVGIYLKISNDNPTPINGELHVKGLKKILLKKRQKKIPKV